MQLSSTIDKNFVQKFRRDFDLGESVSGDCPLSPESSECPFSNVFWPEKVVGALEDLRMRGLKESLPHYKMCCLFFISIFPVSTFGVINRTDGHIKVKETIFWGAHLQRDTSWRTIWMLHNLHKQYHICTISLILSLLLECPT